MNEKNFFDKAKDAASQAGKKAEVLIDLAKIRLKINDRQATVANLFREIGKAAYLARRNAADTEDMTSKFDALDVLTAEIEELEAQIAREKNVCAVCKQKISRTDQFCRACGHPLR